jgi:hypothetical protein
MVTVLSMVAEMERRWRASGCKKKNGVYKGRKRKRKRYARWTMTATVYGDRRGLAVSRIGARLTWK